MGDDAAQNYWGLEFGVIALGAASRIVVIHTGKDRVDGKAEDSILELILDRCG